MPFQWLSENHKGCQNTCFVDVDYPALIARKCEIITKTPQLSNLVQPIDEGLTSTATYLRSPHYIALGCDLTDIEGLSHTLAGEIELASCLVLCVAEVSITYMDTGAVSEVQRLFVFFCRLVALKYIFRDEMELWPLGILLQHVACTY